MRLRGGVIGYEGRKGRALLETVIALSEVEV